MKTFVKILLAVHWFLLVSILTLMVLKGAFEFKRDWDYLAYHLPLALRHFELTTFRTYPHLDRLYGAFPPLPHLVQGLLVKATGLLSASSLLNCLALIGSTLTLRRLFRPFPTRWFLTGCLAIPIMLRHLPSGYVDAWTAFCCLLALAGLMVIDETLFARGKACFLVGCTAAMLSKYQAWPFIGISLIGVTGCFLAHRRTIPKERVRGIVAFIATSFVLSSLMPMANLVRYGNPTFPYPLPIVGHLFASDPEQAMPGDSQKPRSLVSDATPVIFIKSMFEMTRLSAEGFRYSIDQGYDPGPESPHFRMGGWGVLLPLALIFFAIGLFGRRREARLPLSVIGAFLVMVLFVPQNHELRYWQIIPLGTITIFLRFIDREPQSSKMAFKAVLLASFVFSVSSNANMLRFRASTPEKRAPEEAKAFWRQHAGSSETFRVCGKIEWAIFWSGPNFRELKVEACE